MTKKKVDKLRVDKHIHLAKVVVADFWSTSFENYARYVVAITLHRGQISA